MTSEPAQSAEARTEQFFLAEYSGGKARYNVLFPYVLTLLLSLPFIRYFGGGKMTMDEALAAMAPPMMLSLLFSLTSSTVFQGREHRDKALADICAGRYNDLQCCAPIRQLAENAANGDCLVPRAFRSAFQAVKHLPVYLRIRNG
jgi:hypothetical protein